MTLWWLGRLGSLARELFQLEGRSQTSGQAFTSCSHQFGTETGAVGFVQGGVFSLSTLGQLGASEMNGELDLFTYYQSLTYGQTFPALFTNLFFRK